MRRSGSGRKPRADCQVSLGVGVIGVGGRDARQAVCGQLGLGLRSIRWRASAGASSRGWLDSLARKSIFQRALRLPSTSRGVSTPTTYAPHDPEAVGLGAETDVRQHPAVVSDAVLHVRQQAAHHRRTGPRDCVASVIETPKRFASPFDPPPPPHSLRLAGLPTRLADSAPVVG